MILQAIDLDEENIIEAGNEIFRDLFCKRYFLTIYIPT